MSSPIANIYFQIHLFYNNQIIEAYGKYPFRDTNIDTVENRIDWILKKKRLW